MVCFGGTRFSADEKKCGSEGWRGTAHGAGKAGSTKKIFNVRAARLWNDIPQSVKEKTSVNAFKNAYDRWKKDANQKETVQWQKSYQKAMTTSNKRRRNNVICTHIGAENYVLSWCGLYVRPWGLTFYSILYQFFLHTLLGHFKSFYL